MPLNTARIESWWTEISSSTSEDDMSKSIGARPTIRVNWSLLISQYLLYTSKKFELLKNIEQKNFWCFLESQVDCHLKGQLLLNFGRSKWMISRSFILNAQNSKDVEP